MKWKSLFIAIALSLIAGCASLEAPPEELPLTPVPASLTEPCEATLPEPDGPTLGALLEAYVSAAQQYHDCRQRQEALAQTVKFRQRLNQIGGSKP